jgi:hypothetical protein
MIPKYPSVVIGQICGTASAAFVLVLTAVFFFWNPYARSRELVMDGAIGMGITALLAVFAGASALAKRAGLVLLAFLLSFVPLGIYLMGTPGVFRWVGVAQVGYLLAAACLSPRSRRIVTGRIT